MQATESPERKFAQHALALRQLALAGDPQFGGILRMMPGSGIVEPDVLAYLWSVSFSNMMVKLGRHRSEAPVSLYYDPLLDIALQVFWERAEVGYHVQYVRALPGAWLGSSDRQASLLPPWVSEEQALPSLVKTVGERFESFADNHPPGVVEGAAGVTTFAEASLGTRAAIARLIWHANQQRRWTESEASYGWLVPMLSEIERVLVSGDARKIMDVASDTDSVSASSLAQLPVEYVDELALDLVLGSSEHQMLFISSPADGDTYLVVVCRVDRLACQPQRLLLLSLVD